MQGAWNVADFLCAVDPDTKIAQLLGYRNAQITREAGEEILQLVKNNFVDNGAAFEKLSPPVKIDISYHVGATIYAPRHRVDDKIPAKFAKKLELQECNRGSWLGTTEPIDHTSYDDITYFFAVAVTNIYRRMFFSKTTHSYRLPITTDTKTCINREMKTQFKMEQFLQNSTQKEQIS